MKAYGSEDPSGKTVRVVKYRYGGNRWEIPVFFAAYKEFFLKPQNLQENKISILNQGGAGGRDDEIIDETILRKVVVADRVFHNASKREVARAKDVTENFPRMSFEEIVSRILRKGELMESQEERTERTKIQANLVADVVKSSFYSCILSKFTGEELDDFENFKKQVMQPFQQDLKKHVLHSLTNLQEKQQQHQDQQSGNSNSSDVKFISWRLTSWLSREIVADSEISYEAVLVAPIVVPFYLTNKTFQLSTLAEKKKKEDEQEEKEDEEEKEEKAKSDEAEVEDAVAALKKYLKNDEFAGIISSSLIRFELVSTAKPKKGQHENQEHKELKQEEKEEEEEEEEKEEEKEEQEEEKIKKDKENEEMHLIAFLTIATQAANELALISTLRHGNYCWKRRDEMAVTLASEQVAELFSKEKFDPVFGSVPAASLSSATSVSASSSSSATAAASSSPPSTTTQSSTNSKEKQKKQQQPSKQAPTNASKSKRRNKKNKGDDEDSFDDAQDIEEEEDDDDDENNNIKKKKKSSNQQVDDGLDLKTHKDLQNMCKKHSLSTGGSKKQLLERLRAL